MARIKNRIQLENYTIHPERAERIYVRPNFGRAVLQKRKTNNVYFRGEGNRKLSKIATIVEDSDCIISQNKINQIVEIIKK